MIQLVLQACTAALNVDEMNSIHSLIAETPELLQDAGIVTTLIHSYTRCNQPALALSVWRSAHDNAVELSPAGLTCALQACARIGGAQKVMDFVEAIVKESKLVQLDQQLFTAIISVH